MEAGITDADLLIAVTASDELNLLCCTIAKQVGDCSTIARVRTPDYSKEAAYLREKLGMSKTTNIHICAIERNNHVHIPSGNFKIAAGDVVIFITSHKVAKAFFKDIGFKTNQVKSTMIVGGGTAAYYLSLMLLNLGVSVKIIEKDRKRCEELSMLLPKAIIINGDGTDQALLDEEGILMLLPCIVAVTYREAEGFSYFGIAVMTYVFGLILNRKKPETHIFHLKEGCIATALCWILMSFFGCLPFILTGEIPSFTNAMFETISGFTTTGSSILSDVEALSHTSLFWRSFTHWIGGMGVLVFLLAVVPLSGGSNMNLMKAESPGPSVGKLVPTVRSTAGILYKIYFALTLMQIILLLIGKMPAFDAIVTAFGTAGTGGFGIKNDSMASYSPYIQWVVTIFMFLFGVNFNFYYLILFRQVRKAFSMEEVKYYCLIVLGAIAFLFVNILPLYATAGESLLHAAFQVCTIITTTVFALSFEGKDLITNFTAVTATLNNIGPGLELVGPTQNFAHFSTFSKWVLAFDMLAGRLELFPLLMLFYPELWKEAFTSHLSFRKRKRSI